MKDEDINPRSELLILQECGGSVIVWGIINAITDIEILSEHFLTFMVYSRISGLFTEFD